MKENTKKSDGVLPKDCPDCGYPNNGHVQKEITNIDVGNKTSDQSLKALEERNAFFNSAEYLKAIREPTGRSGYEIRLDLLKMAADMAEQKYNNEYNAWREMYKDGNRSAPPPQDNRVIEALANADRFYQFVQKK